MSFLDHGQQEFHERTFRRVQGRGAVVRETVFHDCSFVGCTLAEITFAGCRFRSCAFRDCDLALADLTDSVLADVRFENCKLLGINWTDAAWTPLSALRFVNCNLSHSTFRGVALPRTTLRGCTAKDCDFTDANLAGADCTQTVFSESRFFHTDLTEADFTGADEYSIHAGLNTLKRTKFSMPQAVALLRSLDIILIEV